MVEVLASVFVAEVVGCADGSEVGEVGADHLQSSETCRKAGQVRSKVRATCLERGLAAGGTI